MFRIIKEKTNINFMGSRYIFLTLSCILVLGSIFVLYSRGLNFGIDFTGGIELRVKTENISIEELRTSLIDKELTDISVQDFGNKGEFLIKLSALEENLNPLVSKIENIFKDTFEDRVEVLKVDVVGPRVGKELRLGGIYSVIYALIGILIYIAFRFNYQFSPGAVFALIHDVIITLGVFSLLQRQFTLSTVAAVLTIVGYSLNDTIVVYDRIREKMGVLKGSVLSKVVNRAINETLSRTILTSLTTLLVVLTLIIYGGEVIADFSTALLIGVLVGTYSSVFVASPVLIMFNARKEKKRIKNVKK